MPVRGWARVALVASVAVIALLLAVRPCRRPCALATHCRARELAKQPQVTFALRVPRGGSLNVSSSFGSGCPGSGSGKNQPTLLHWPGGYSVRGGRGGKGSPHANLRGGPWEEA